ncbi:MAG: alpha/beta fold hydrolase [Bacillota bacterium]|nr:alpha/beta fold hydrolase [Bacillota bacterium]
MNIERQLIYGKEFSIPSIMLIPSNSKGAAVITHGYGGCKEEQLGLAWRVAEIGITTCVIDLRGHGENDQLLDENVDKDLEIAIQYCKRFGKVVAIGHSLGGRLSLLSKADYAIGLSPALNRKFSNQTQETIKALRSYRVKEISPNINFETLNKLPKLQFTYQKNSEIIFGSRDVPEIIASCSELKEKGLKVIKIDDAMHNDIFLQETTFKYIIEQLKDWFQIY